MTVTGKETKPKIRTPVPGPRGKAIVKRDTASLATTTKTAPVTAVQGRGVVIEDADGNVMLDFASGIGVLNTGHCHPKVVSAIQQQAGRLMHFAGTDFYYEQQVRLAERLSDLVPIQGRTKTFFTQSGTESVEAAIKIVKAATERPLLLAFLGAFHGRTQGSLGLTASKAKQRRGFFSPMPGVVHMPFPNPYRNMWGINGYDEPQELANRAIAYMERLFETVLPRQDVAAVFWEPVQGEGGYVVPPPMYPKMLHDLCKENGILLVADEVQTGFGRTGKWFASEHFGIKPDVMALAKAMGSGFPIGACVFAKKLDFNEQGRHSNTYGGNVLGCAAALATIDVIEKEKLVANSERVGKHLGRHLNELKETHASIGDHRGLGLMRALEFITPSGAPNTKLRNKVEVACWKRGLISLQCGTSSLRFIPALNVSRGQVDGAMHVLADALKAAKA